ncbi:bifunctional 6-phosphofructo-2-kinase/fructose-2,6-bisphosphate 2-phosphatase [Tuber magnatum]|uniref:Bifunctional 6-phosphofructo-2-kinase/fructose-2,6-bisphosphate 2-phosphatase n=1 Tax=Tuber magnatum TaxID=42249 RepID=A0A317STL3_9PEZI|nr:bifunctional 6-phosphofructo-2-kinase/fructose-2,6-bisphosphate 2-phosphatase [Tuber magnatum]
MAPSVQSSPKITTSRSPKMISPHYPRSPRIVSAFLSPVPPPISNTPQNLLPLDNGFNGGPQQQPLQLASPLPIRQTQHSSIAKSVMSAPGMSRSYSAGKECTELLAPPAPLYAGRALTDTPATTAPNSPRIRATTLDIPGLTKSRVSPDGRIARRDIGAKLVIVMVGLPARGKSYITQKVARYLNWLQHDTKIFNHRTDSVASVDIDGGVDQSASFFDPANKAAAELREKVAMETLDELLDYVLHQGGSVGILDATNSTLERRKAVVDRVREVAGKELGVLFLESECHDQQLLEANMRLKLSGPDYKGQDPVKALEDFKKRVEIYEKNYVPLGEYEEKAGMQFIKMIDVGRKIVTHQTKGFLAAQTVYFLLNFNLAHRQIWITRHGESLDNVAGKIGGNALLSDNGEKYARTLAQFMDVERRKFREKQLQKHESSHMPPRPGDTTPPNPEYSNCCNQDEDGRPLEKNFCVWTSMLARSIETAQFFDEEEYDIKEMRMLNELNAGVAEGLTYAEIKRLYPKEYDLRRHDKLHYRYPGAGGESYLDVINRLRAVIVEVERMTDHVLLIGHRVVARVLLAYFLGLEREDVAKLDVPLGTIYVLEPKPYGVEFRAYKYNSQTEWFDFQPDFKLKNEEQKDIKVNIKVAVSA